MIVKGAAAMNRQFKSERGVGLIEVLVTLLILSTTLIALSALQTRSLQFNQGAYFRSQANMLAYDMLDRIRVNDGLPAVAVAPNPAREALSAYTMAETVAASATAATTPLSAVDKYQWLRSINASLPGGKGQIACSTARVCRVTITWTELNSSNSEDSEDEDQSTFTYEARI
jgi:type IV pilus assembly protein PilV